MRRLYAAAEWVTSDAPEDRREKDDIENQIDDVLNYIDDLEIQLQELKQESQRHNQGEKKSLQGNKEKYARVNDEDSYRDEYSKETSRSSSSRHSFQNYISFDD